MLDRLSKLIKESKSQAISMCPLLSSGTSCAECEYNKEGTACITVRRADYLLKNNVIVLPCGVEQMVWCLAQPCGGCENFNEPMREEFIEQCRVCSKYEIVQCKFDYELIPEFGKTVFLTKEEAEHRKADVIHGSKDKN